MRRRVERLATALGALVAVGAFFGPRAAWAEPGDEAPMATGPVYVVWIAPLECPRQPEVSAEIDRLLGAQPRRSREGVEVRARVVRREGAEPASSWHAQVELVSAGETETREVDGESCASLAHAVAVIAAIASDASSAPPPRRRSIFVAGSAALDVGTLPHAAFGVELGAGWRGRVLELGIDGALFAPEHAESPRPGAGADFLLARARAHACAGATFERLTLAPCAVLGFDLLSAHGTGSDLPADASGTALTLGADVVARAQLTPLLALRVAGGIAAPLGRHAFVVAGAGAVHRPAAVAVPVTFGAEFDF